MDIVGRGDLGVHLDVKAGRRGAAQDLVARHLLDRLEGLVCLGARRHAEFALGRERLHRCFVMGDDETDLVDRLTLAPAAVIALVAIDDHLRRTLPG
ncbi:hypothetical protein D3C71_1948250 [compost metagenome]